MSGLRVVLVTPNFDNNSLGRTYCLWVLARHLGWTCRVVGVKGERIWSPLADDAFAADCVLPAGGASAQAREAAVRDEVSAADVVVAVKLLPSSFGVALDASRSTGTPLVLDVDDPDYEVRVTWLPRHELVARYLLKPYTRRIVQLRREARAQRVMVSNPVLQDWYGGLLVPHVRSVPPPRQEVGAESVADGTTVVRFVGSPRGHKGVEQLREAVARLAGDGFRLEVTGPEPPDARPWERWWGTTSMARGAELVATADVVALPSLAETWARAQLPVKLVDALVHGRPVVASDLPPLRWALDGAGSLVAPGDVDALTEALAELRDPRVRALRGAAARARALSTFTPEAVSPAFRAQVLAAVAGEPQPARPSTPQPRSAL
ncbi:glycosyltransferase family 4 protein [Streptomyces sp. NP160]|uniref:glycosyltransferase n=1 Tax=Streptomyces sp. NP160 TaxID=2586637 RepID=UPI0011192041|nr:glycosyltransferase [Streptomyces sp. NP160]TNM61048.1 glycosyltransferase family 4 protein [Streptomyces sp. NP160]